LSEQARNLSGQIQTLEREVLRRAPQPIVDLMNQSGTKPDASMLAPHLARIASSALTAASVFVLAFILVFYFLIEGETTYEWVRHLVPARHRSRFDQTAREAHEVAYGFVVGNVVTSACAGIYVFTALTILGVPAALVLALLAFLFDFIPVLGFFLSCGPAVIMAATVSPSLAIAMVPVYLFYDFLENYFIAPRVYGDRLELSKVAVLLAFAAGAQLAGVIGALLALPVAAVIPTIDRIWLRRARNSQKESGEA
jgi:predicted PurR-regulated permease PerM